MIHDAAELYSQREKRVNDAIELKVLACGATAVGVGAANFTGFEAPSRILAELRAELAARGFSSPAAARGVALGV